MGHLGKLASDLHTASEVSDKLGEILQNNQPWKKYLQEDFASIKKVEAAKLGSAEAEEDVDVDQTVCLIFKYFIIFISINITLRLINFMIQLKEDLKMIFQIHSQEVMKIYLIF